MLQSLLAEHIRCGSRLQAPGYHPAMVTWLETPPKLTPRSMWPEMRLPVTVLSEARMLKPIPESCLSRQTPFPTQLASAEQDVPGSRVQLAPPPRWTISFSAIRL